MQNSLKMCGTRAEEVELVLDMSDMSQRETLRQPRTQNIWHRSESDMHTGLQYTDRIVADPAAIGSRQHVRSAVCDDTSVDSPGNITTLCRSARHRTGEYYKDSRTLSSIASARNSDDGNGTGPGRTPR